MAPGIVSNSVIQHPSTRCSLATKFYGPLPARHGDGLPRNCVLTGGLTYIHTCQTMAIPSVLYAGPGARHRRDGFPEVWIGSGYFLQSRNLRSAEILRSALT